MKRIANHMLWLAVTLLAVTLPAGCSSDDDGPDPDMTYDFAPINVNVSIVDAQGSNLLDPDVEGNIIGDKLTVEYKGQTFDTRWRTPYFSWDGTLEETRAYHASFKGIIHHPLNNYKEVSAENPWIIEIGELARDENFDVTLPLTYKDKVFSIRVVNSFKWKNQKPVIKTNYYLDGQEQEGGNLKALKIVL